MTHSARREATGCQARECRTSWANSSERNTAEGGLSPCPEGAPQARQCGVAVLGKGAPLPADCVLPWRACGALKRHKMRDRTLGLGGIAYRGRGAPYENRTRVSALRGQRPGPLDEGSFRVVSFTIGRTC